MYDDQRCHTCRWWSETEASDYPFSDQPSDTEWEPHMRRGFCDLIGWIFAKKPPVERLALLNHGDRGSGSILTRADFGCVMHKGKDAASHGGDV